MANKSGFADQELSYKALEQLLRTLSQARAGDFSLRMSAAGEGMEREVGDAVNELMTLLATQTTELERVAEAVAQGDLRARLSLDKATGAWGQQARAINGVVVTFGKHIAELRRVTKAIHSGDMSRPVTVGPEATHRGGELARAAEDINAMITHVQQVTSEIARVFAEVGLDGRLNTQCHIGDASGAWGLLVGSANAASASLSEQVQDLVTTAQQLCAGNLAARATVTSRGDLQPLKQSLNGAAESLAALCDELRRLAQEVSTEGKLSVELRHPNPQGQWQSAQDAVNRMFDKLAGTWRTLAENAERVVEGDFELDIDESLRGEMLAPARVLGELAEQQQATQHALSALIDGRFEAISLRGHTQRDLTLSQLALRLKREYFRAIRGAITEARERSTGSAEFAGSALAAIAQAVTAAAGAYYVIEDRFLKRSANFGCEADDAASPQRVGDGLLGKVASTGEPLLLEELDKYGMRVRSGLLEITPNALLLYPVKREGRVIGVLELLFLNTSAPTARELLDYLTDDLARGPRVLEKSAEAVRVRDLEEELVIANARLERMEAELQNRSLRAAAGA
ncbi:MAG: GAF domain-containing protein [Polyangiales bacterium]